MPGHTSAARIALADAITIPAAPAAATGLPALYEDGGFTALYARVQDALRALPEWYNLAHVEAFAVAAASAGELLPRFGATQQRRALAHLLWQLLPAASRVRPHLPLPDEIARRADDHFTLVPGDIPRVAASWVAFLADPELVVKALASAPLVLVPRSQAKAPHPRAPAALVQVEAIEGGMVQAHVLGTPDEKARASSLDSVAAWLLSAGPDARGLDLRSDDDRALLLTWAHLLRERVLNGRTALAWLQDGNAPPSVRERVVDACLDAAVTAVGTYSLDVLACRFLLPFAKEDGTWPARAAERLRTTMLPDGPVVREIVARAPVAQPTTHLLWADAIVTGAGFAAGHLTELGAGRAFARLATSVLAPLGVVPLSGLRDGSGAVVVQRIVQGDDGAVMLRAPRLISFGERVRNEPLPDAWREQRGVLLPDPKDGPRHDLAAMPAWFALFLEGIDEGFTSRPPQPAAARSDR